MTVCVCVCLCACMRACVWCYGKAHYNMHYICTCRIAYLCEQLQRLFPKQKVQLMYDIACNLEKHLKVMTITTVATGCFTVCVFHRPIIDVTYLAALSLQFPFFMPMDMSLLARYIFVYDNLTRISQLLCHAISQFADLVQP